MKNHFFMAYSGNKRGEMEYIYNNIDLDNIETIIEPFCGSSAFSFYISTKHPKKYKYILNDINKELIDLYKVFKNENETNEFIKNVNKLLIDVDKEKYKNIIKNNTIEAYYIKNKIYQIRAGLFPIEKIRTENYIKSINDLNECGICKFLRSEQIIFLNEDAINVMKTYQNNEKTLIYLDPPYLNSCNDFYQNSNTNIYEYLYFNHIKDMKSRIYLTLEDNWIIRLLFQNDTIGEPQKKLYSMSKKKTNHILISNV